MKNEILLLKARADGRGKIAEAATELDNQNLRDNFEIKARISALQEVLFDLADRTVRPRDKMVVEYNRLWKLRLDDYYQIFDGIDQSQAAHIDVRLENNRPDYE